MSSGTQIDLDWAGIDAGQGGAAAPPASAANSAGGDMNAYFTDEEILGMAPVGQTLLSVPQDVPARPGQQQMDAAPDAPLLEGQARVPVLPEAMPPWMQALAGDPTHGAEAQQLWQEHQAFRAAFSSPEEARAIKEMFPGGAQEVQALKQASQSVDRIDAAIFSGDARAQSEVIAEIARANPAAFRSMFAEAAKVLGGMSAGDDAVARLFRGGEVASPQAKGPVSQDPGYRNQPSPGSSDGKWGSQQPSVSGQDASVVGHAPANAAENRRPFLRQAEQDAGATSTAAAPGTNHESQVTNHHSQELRASQSPQFDPAAYASFERSTNDVVARDVRSTIHDTLSRVLPEGVAEGAARRIGDDIFNEVHRALAADRTLSEQVAGVLRVPLSSGQAPLASGQGWRFGSAEQQRVASLLAGRAKQLVPSVARRVIGEWTSSVLGTARSKAARQAAAASRVDIAAPGGSLDAMPLRAMSRREVDYASMSDDEILGM